MCVCVCVCVCVCAKYGMMVDRSGICIRNAIPFSDVTSRFKMLIQQIYENIKVSTKIELNVISYSHCDTAFIYYLSIFSEVIISQPNTKWRIDSSDSVVFVFDDCETVVNPAISFRVSKATCERHVSFTKINLAKHT